MSPATWVQIRRLAAGASPPSAGRSVSTGGTDRLGLVLFAALAAAYAAALIAAPAPLPQDLPDWAYQGWLLERRVAGDAVAAGFALKPYPVPNTLSTLLFAGMLAVVEPAAATRIAALLPLLLGAACLWPFARRAAPSWPGLFAAAWFGTLVITTPFWFGYLNYAIGFALLMPLLAASLERWPPLRLAAASTAIFFVSAVPWLALMLVAGWRLAFEARRPRLLWALLPSLALALWYAAARLLLEGDLAPPEGAAADGLQAALAAHFGWKPLTFTTLGPARDFIIGDRALLPLPQPLAAWGMLALNAAFALAAAAAVLRGLRRARPGVLGLAPALLLLAGFLAAPPVNFFSLINVGERLLLIALLVLLPLARLGPRALALLLVLALPAHGLNLWALARAGVAAAPYAHGAPNPYRQPLAGRVFILDAIGERRAIPIAPGYATGIWRE